MKLKEIIEKLDGSERQTDQNAGRILALFEESIKYQCCIENVREKLEEMKDYYGMKAQLNYTLVVDPRVSAKTPEQVSQKIKWAKKYEVAKKMAETIDFNFRENSE